jgi:peptidoglycan hydrolase-like protein with peptidoglycan-binding domain
MQIKKIASFLTFTLLTTITTRAIATDYGNQFSTDQDVLDSTAEYAEPLESNSIDGQSAVNTEGQNLNLQEIPAFSNSDNNSELNNSEFNNSQPSSDKQLFETPYYNSDGPVRRRRERTFSEGAKGFIVGALQHRLQDKGFYNGRIDREFGPRTKAAVMDFQTSVNLIATGVVDKTTWMILMTDSEKPVAQSSVMEAPSVVASTVISPENSSILFTKGDKGSKIRTLQTRLNQLGYEAGPVDGIFGNKTKAAVEQFQLAMELPISGIVDENTWQVLGNQY